ncbi:ATP-binding cassette domain-containing protein [Vagococcus sp.]|uniref:ATP-binding cassette domain-containing protein n=1 Tax=Vagococcus sp. TaxID=1933889 RepID=UPI003FCD669F
MKMVILDQVSFSRNNQLILNSLDYEFEQGTFTVLRGDSGSGKSSLLKLIAGFTDLEYDGKILVNNKEQRSRSILNCASTVGMVFQNPNQQFTMGSLRKEITFALENLLIEHKEIEQRLKKAVDLTGTQNLIDREITSLSGGEKQRVSLAVLLAMDSPILLLDEPFASIDRASRKQLIGLLGQLRDLGKTIILCDHDLSDYCSMVDQVVTLSKDGLKRETLTILENDLTPILSKKTNSINKLITLDQVKISQGKRELLTSTDFSFQEGITTLTGDNGIGKSTLLKAMVQQKKYNGKMFLYEKRMRKQRKLYQQLTLAVQDATHQFVCLTPKEELSYNVELSQEVQNKQVELLEKLNLMDKLNGSLFHLSEGQKKMIQLIAMISLDREVLLLDEPFTGLDEKACQIFMDWMKEKEQQFIIVSHRLAPLSGNSDHHVVFANQSLNFIGEQLVKEKYPYDYCQNQFA